MIQKPEIILVDDHPHFRQVLKSFLSTENIATVIGEASNGMEFVQLLPALKPDLVIMDIDMPVMNGAEAIQKALKLRPALKIIACTMFLEEDYYYKMIDLGVKGIIQKSSDINEFEKAFTEILRGESYFPLAKLGKVKL